jgi:hypothetical protein
MDENKPTNEVILARLTCPVRARAGEVTGVCRDLRRAVTQLRRSTEACEECPARRDCPVLLEFQAGIREAVRELVVELGLEV